MLTDRDLRLTVRMLRTDRHSCYVSHRPSFLLTVRIQSVHLIIAPGPTVDGPRYTKEVEREDGNMSITGSIGVAQTNNRVLEANCYVDYSFY